MAVSVTLQNRVDVSNLYVALFGRAPDGEGLGFWANMLATGTSLVSVANTMFATAPARTYYPSFATNQEIISGFYLKVLGRTADTDGLAYWTAKLTATGGTPGSVIAEMISVVTSWTPAGGAANAASDAAGALSKALFVNKADVSLYFGLTNGTVAGATVALNGVTEVASTVTAAKAVIDGGLGAIGQTFTLTTSADTIVGTSGNDTFNGLAGATAADATDTLSAPDIINAGAGTDTLNISTTAGNTNVLKGAQVSNVEIVNIRSTLGTATLDASNIAGLTAVNANVGVGDVTVTNLATGASIGVIGNGTVLNGTTTFSYKTATDAVTINVSGGTTGGNISSSTASAVAATINSTGATKNTVGTIDLGTGTNVTSLTVNAATNLTAVLAADYAATAALTVSGAAASVDLGTVGNFKTIDASGLTAGGLTIAGGSNLTSFKGGQGNDVFTTVTAYGATTAGIINAGAGTADVLVIADDAIASTATGVGTAAQGALYTNFEVLRNTDASAVIDVSLVAGITAIQQENAGSATFNKLTATQAANVTVRANVANLTLALATDTGTSDVVSVTFGDATLLPTSDITALLTVNGFETINLKAVQGKTATDLAANIAAFAADKATALNLTGTSFALENVGGFTKAVVIDGSALTGYLTVVGNLVNGSTVTSGVGKDTFTLGTGFGTYNAGAGNDTINATAAQLNTGADYNTINGGDGVDTLNITGGTALTIVDNNLSKISNVEKFVIATTGVNAQSISTGGFFDAAFKAGGIDLTTVSTIGNITVDMTSFTGAATISATTAGTAGGEGVVNIQTGSGADKVTVVSTATSVTNVISTFAGNDTIVGGLGIETITGGLGADTMTGGGGVDIFAFGTNGSVAGTSMDIITDFNTSGADVLTFGATTNIAYGIDTTTLVAGSNVNTTVGGLITFATADNTLALKLVAIQADAQLDAVNSVAMFVDGANTYVYYAGAAIGNADDQVIQLTGITSLVTIIGGTTTTIA